MKTGTEIFLRKLSDSELFFDTKEAVRTELEATSTVVKYLREVSARELYLKYDCTSLHQFATEKLGYCASSAQARINAMKLVIALPEVEEKIESGELFLTSAAKLYAFFRLEKKAKKTYSREEQLRVVSDCLSKPTREVDRELAKRNPEVASVESLKPIGEDRFALKITIAQELEAKIRKLKGLLAHSCPNITTVELLEKLVELGLEKFDPVRKAARCTARIEAKRKTSPRTYQRVGITTVSHFKSDMVSQSSPSFHAHEVISEVGGLPKSCEQLGDLPSRPQVAEQNDLKDAARNQDRARYIPADVRDEVWRRNGGQGCEHKSSDGGTCGSQHALQIDHVHGFARGGGHNFENLRVLCAKHNRFAWKVARVSTVRTAVVHYVAS